MLSVRDAKNVSCNIFSKQMRPVGNNDLSEIVVSYLGALILEPDLDDPDAEAGLRG